MKMSRSKLNTTLAAALITLVGMGSAGVASAQQQDALPQDVINVSNAKLSLPEAVALAEKHQAGSKATQAELEFKNGRLYYEVEIVTPDKKVLDLKIDANDGSIFQTKPDNND